MSFTVIIPARYGSTRLPGKPLIEVGGLPLIRHVIHRAQQSEAKRIIVATDDPRIAQAAQASVAEVCLTRDDHPSGTDRLQEVVSQLGLANDDIVVNVQGDEPLLPAVAINQVAANLAASSQASAATLSEPVASQADAFNANVVKVVTDKEGMALYFSRAPIPWDRDHFQPGQSDAAITLMQRHIGIYAYRVGLLHQFVRWSCSALEQLEKLEQLRILENGHLIHVAPACVPVPGGVDTADDLERLRAYFLANPVASRGDKA